MSAALVHPGPDSEGSLVEGAIGPAARRLVLARDRFVIKPLFYRDAGGELAFASELDALPKGDLDLDAVEAFLAFNVVPAPLSIFREIRKVPPGHLLTWTDGRLELTRF